MASGRAGRQAGGKWWVGDYRQGRIRVLSNQTTWYEACNHFGAFWRAWVGERGEEGHVSGGSLNLLALTWYIIMGHFGIVVRLLSPLHRY